VSKKEKTNKGKPGKKQAEKGKNTKTLIIVALSVIVVIAVVVVAMQLKGTSKKASYSVSSVDDRSLRKGETRKTLSPSLFADPFVSSMYQAANDIPHVFDSVKCYCFCEREPFHHVSLLSCFVDRHAEA
jgi:flagellar basal body-associated protein FliL